MARVEVRIPRLGKSVSQALVSGWRKQVGDRVERDEMLAEFETDKATMEVVAPAAGRLAEILVREGQKVASGDLVAFVETDAGVPIRGAAGPAAPTTAPTAALIPGRVPAVVCLRCGTRLEAAHSAGGRMAFAGEPVRLLVCRTCGHVEMIAENPARF